jgi:hypothetical protein
VKQVHIVVGVLAIAANAAAALYGGWCWREAESRASFWWLLRAGQAAVLVEAAIGGILAAIGDKVPSLHLLYGFLTVAVSFIGESLRISAAQMVLDARGFASAADVGELDPAQQRVIVLTIVQREVGVMALAALVTVGLLVRAAGTGG